MLCYKNNINTVNEIMDKYNLSLEDKAFLWKIIFPILNHEEFQRRMNELEFAHHDNISLGYHIISDAVVTYLLTQKKQLKEEQQALAITIAMFHDLYERPWQNSGIKKERLTNRHGFVHPIEAVINANTWYPKYFESDLKSKIIIDGVIHHMYPFPVRALDTTPAELNNEKKFYLLDNKIQNLIISSTLRSKIGHISLCQSKYLEGRIMSKADKIVSIIKDLKSFNGLKACITGKNPNLDSFSRKRSK